MVIGKTDYSLMRIKGVNQIFLQLVTMILFYNY